MKWYFHEFEFRRNHREHQLKRMKDENLKLVMDPRPLIPMLVSLLSAAAAEKISPSANVEMICLIFVSRVELFRGKQNRFNYLGVMIQSALILQIFFWWEKPSVFRKRSTDFMPMTPLYSHSVRSFIIILQGGSGRFILSAFFWNSLSICSHRCGNILRNLEEIQQLETADSIYDLDGSNIIRPSISQMNRFHS